MKKVDQTITGAGGNCYPACIASILECSLEAVPNYEIEENSEVLWAAWFKKHGLFSLTYDVKMTRFISPVPEDGTFVIASGKSRNLPGFYHAVVGVLRHLEKGWRIDVYFDPHPSRDAIEEIHTVEFLIKTDKYIKPKESSK